MPFTRAVPRPAATKLLRSHPDVICAATAATPPRRGRKVSRAAPRRLPCGVDANRVRHLGTPAVRAQRCGFPASGGPDALLSGLLATGLTSGAWRSWLATRCPASVDWTDYRVADLERELPYSGSAGNGGISLLRGADFGLCADANRLQLLSMSRRRRRLVPAPQRQPPVAESFAPARIAVRCVAQQRRKRWRVRDGLEACCTASGGGRCAEGRARRTLRGSCDRSTDAAISTPAHLARVAFTAAAPSRLRGAAMDEGTDTRVVLNRGRRMSEWRPSLSVRYSDSRRVPRQRQRRATRSWRVIASDGIEATRSPRGSRRRGELGEYPRGRVPLPQSS